MKTCTKPLERTILIGIILFIFLLSIILCSVQYVSYRNILFRENEHNISNILKYVEGKIDKDDLSVCIETGIRSEKYEALQKELDEIRNNTDVAYVYIIIPLNTEPKDNIRNIIAGASKEEYENEPDDLVRLNQLSGDAYPPAAAEKYLKAYESGKLTFFEGVTKWGDDYTGLQPLFDSKGNRIAALCVDMDIRPIDSVLMRSTFQIVIVVTAVGIIFAVIFFRWLTATVTDPIEQMEKSVTAFAMNCRDQKNENQLTLDLPKIQTDNEICSLSVAIGQMAAAMKDYVKNILSAESELARMVVLANKDALTSVRNKNAYDTYEAELQAWVDKGDTNYAILMADLNYLKRMNDTLGHDKGDLYLQNCTKTLCDIFTHSPVFRIGGDEFVVILNGQDYENRYALVKTAREIFNSQTADDSLEPWEKCSVALGLGEPDGTESESVQDVKQRADEDMYREKERMKITR